MLAKQHVASSFGGVCVGPNFGADFACRPQQSGLYVRVVYRALSNASVVMEILKPSESMIRAFCACHLYILSCGTSEYPRCRYPCACGFSRGAISIVFASYENRPRPRHCRVSFCDAYYLDSFLGVGEKKRRWSRLALYFSAVSYSHPHRHHRGRAACWGVSSAGRDHLRPESIVRRPSFVSPVRRVLLPYPARGSSLSTAHATLQLPSPVARHCDCLSDE